jgi:hypothetical protein
MALQMVTMGSLKIARRAIVGWVESPLHNAFEQTFAVAMAAFFLAAMPPLAGATYCVGE